MADKKSTVVFCDIGDILGAAVFSPPPPRLERLDLFPFVATVLEQLRNNDNRLGIISNTGEESSKEINDILKKAGIFEFFDPDLLIYSSEVGLKKDSPEIFKLAVEKAGLKGTPEKCLFVGEDPRERSFASQAGLRVARDLSLLGGIFPSAAIIQPDISNLNNCIEDVRLAALIGDPGPDEPSNYNQLLGRLEASRVRLPPLYRETVFAPYVKILREIGESGFSSVLARDPRRESSGALMMDIAQAILQNGELYNDKETDAFEEVVSDLYDGFLSAQDRKGIKMPDHAVVPPLVKWGNPNSGPYTWTVAATFRAFGVEAAIVNLPPANARRGLMAWASLGHETAGHDILHADEGLQAELSIKVQRELRRQNIGFGLDDYWSARIDETASDVMGILNMGPAAGIGLIAFFRGLNAAFSKTAKLRNEGPARDEHPADILRGYLAAATVRLLSFDGAPIWGNILEQETDRDLETIRLAGIVVSSEVAKRSADIVAGIIATQKLETLNRHALIEIQDWRNRDEEIVNRLQKALTTATPLGDDLASGTYAAHVVASATMAALTNNAQIPVLFARMVSILKIMHDKNPSWGPLFIVNPSTVTRDLAYIPQSD
jgi:hypothetical protein